MTTTRDGIVWSSAPGGGYWVTVGRQYWAVRVNRVGTYHTYTPKG